MTLDEYLDLFTTYYGLWPSERKEVKRIALRDRDNARICFAALARDIEADPRHGINERVGSAPGYGHEQARGLKL